MEPACLLFDLDGTLVHGVEAIQDAFAHAVSREGLAPVPGADVAGMIGAPLRAMFRELCAVDEEGATRLVSAYRARFEVMAPRLVRPTPGAMAALECYRHLPMAVVTTKAVDPALVVLRAVGMDKLLPVVVGIDSVREPKPSPEGIHLALAQLGASTSGAIFVGDTAMDVAAGRAAGTRTLAVTNGHGDPASLRAAGPDKLIPDLTHLALAVSRL